MPVCQTIRADEKSPKTNQPALPPPTHYRVNNANRQPRLREQSYRRQEPPRLPIKTEFVLLISPPRKCNFPFEGVPNFTDVHRIH